MALVEMSKAQHNSSSLILARGLLLPAADRQQIDVLVYISLVMGFSSCPHSGKGQKGEMDW